MEKLSLKNQNNSGTIEALHNQEYNPDCILNESGKNVRLL